MVRLRQQNSSFLLLEASRIKRKIDGNSYLINRNLGGDLHEKEHIKNRRFGNADYSCCIYSVCIEPSRNEFSLEQYHYLVTVWFVCSCDSRAVYCA